MSSVSRRLSGTILPQKDTRGVGASKEREERIRGRIMGTRVMTDGELGRTAAAGSVSLVTILQTLFVHLLSLLSLSSPSPHLSTKRRIFDVNLVEDLGN